MYDSVPQFLPSLLTPLLRSFPSMLWMFPREPAVAAESAGSPGDGSSTAAPVWDETFIETPSASIGVGNTGELLELLDSTLLRDLQPQVEGLVSTSMSDPGVKASVV